MGEDFSGLAIESHVLQPWEEERSFGDVLYGWMGSAPWLAISLAAHVLVFFVISAIPWAELSKEPNQVMEAKLLTPEEIPFDEPEDEPEPEVVEQPVLDEPVLQELEPVDVPEENLEDPEDFSDSDPSPFDPSDLNNNILGLGPGGGDGEKMIGRRRRPGVPEGSNIHDSLERGLEWLAQHQSPDGYWDGDNFMNNCRKGISNADGAGHAQHDVGLTGLALLTFLGAGYTSSEGPYKDVVAQGIRWLVQRQDSDGGLIGEKSSHEFLYNHALASLALCEAYYASKSPLLRRPAQEAIHYIQRARNPYGAWRYEVPPIGDNDTSVTGWMVFALSAAQEAGLEVDMSAFDGALSWIDEATDLSTGRVGYDSFGSLSSRTVANEHYPRERGEAMTAVGLLCRIFIANARGEDIRGQDVLEKHADLLLRTPPEWDPDGFGCDMYYWYYGSYAMFQMGGRHWKSWKAAMEPAVLNSQREDGDFQGSWDPVGPWGYAGGRIYATAMQTLCLEVYFRYGRLMGAR